MSRRQTSTNPRKMPKQERSRTTVDAITQAAAYILIEQGWSHLTTNAVAERAGVNIGSLYQYFPNKEAIAAELQRSHVAKTHQILLTTLPQLSSQPSLRDALRLLVEAIIEEHVTAPEVHRAIAEEFPGYVKCEADQGLVEEAVLSALLPYMKNVPDPKLAVVVMMVAAHAVIHEVALYRPEMINHPDFADEVVSLVEPYLQRG